jgi:hypothetical protein
MEPSRSDVFVITRVLDFATAPRVFFAMPSNSASQQTTRMPTTPKPSNPSSSPNDDSLMNYPFCSYAEDEESSYYLQAPRQDLSLFCSFPAVATSGNSKLDTVSSTSANHEQKNLQNYHQFSFQNMGEKSHQAAAPARHGLRSSLSTTVVSSKPRAASFIPGGFHYAPKSPDLGLSGVSRATTSDQYQPPISRQSGSLNISPIDVFFQPISTSEVAQDTGSNNKMGMKEELRLNREWIGVLGDELRQKERVFEGAERRMKEKISNLEWENVVLESEADMRRNGRL